MAITARTTAAGISAVANGSSTNLTPQAENYANDVALLLIAQESDVDTVTVSGGFVRISTWVYGTSMRFWLYGRRNPTGASSPVVSRGNTTGRFWAFVREFVGVTQFGDPWEVVGTPVTGAAYTDPLNITGITTLTQNAMVICMAAMATGNINSLTSVTATSPAALTASYWEIAVGGGEVSVCRAYAVKSTNGATGNIIVDFGTSPDNIVGGIAIALTESPRVPSHTFDTKTEFGGTTSNPIDGFLSVASGCTAVALTVFTFASSRVSAPSMNTSTMLLASSATSPSDTTFTELYYLTGSYYSTLSFSIPNSASSTVWAVAVGLRAPEGRLSAFHAAGAVSDIAASPSGSLTTDAYTGAAIVSGVATDEPAWSPYGRTGIQLYDRDAGAWGYGAQYILQEVGGLTSLLWEQALTYILQEGFEAGTNRNLSGYNGWTGTDSTYLTITDARAQAGSRSLQITSGFGHVNYKAFSASQNGTKFTVDCYFNVITAGDNDRHLIIIGNGAYTGTANVIAFVGCTADWTGQQYLLRSAGTGWAQVVAINTSQWYHCEIQVNLDANPDTFEIWLDGTHYGPYDCTNNGLTAAGISVRSPNIAGTTLIGIDAVNAYLGPRSATGAGMSPEGYSLVMMAFEVQRRTSQIIAEVQSIIETIYRRATKYRILQEVERVVEGIWKVNKIQVFANEVLQLVSSVLFRFILLAEVTDSVIEIGDVIARKCSLRRVYSETVGMNESIPRSRAIRRIKNEILNIWSTILRYFVPGLTGGTSIVLTDEGAVQMLTQYLNGISPSTRDLTLKLYVNDYWPTHDSTAANFTEAAGGGYAAKTLTDGNWYISDTQDPAKAIYAMQEWTFNGPLDNNDTIYGYYVVDANGIVLFAERTESVYTPLTPNSTYQVTLQPQMSFGIPV